MPSTLDIDQLTRIMTVVGTPSDELLAKIQSEEARSYIKSMPKMKAKPFPELFSNASPEAIDMLEKMLNLDPDLRFVIPYIITVTKINTVIFPLDRQLTKH